jgi:alpha-beta hydrolase superfamily lysophospholipase
MTFSVDPLTMSDGGSVAVYRWPPPSGRTKAVVQITHGMAEHCARYDYAAQALTRAGYAVVASDHRGHGHSAKSPADYGFLAQEHGFDRVVEDLYEVNTEAARAYPGVPRVLFAHSFGSFVAQAYLFRHADTLAGCVLSGSNLSNANTARAGLALALIERQRVGARGKSALLQWLSFGNFNRHFQPTRTEFDWLSRDNAQVDKYVADPACGFPFTVQAWIDLFKGFIAIDSAPRQRNIPKTLPIYVFSGENDPVGRAGRGPRALVAAYQRAGLTNVTLKLYPNARHETLNEINRDEVLTDLVAWLDRTIAAPNA